MTTWNFVAVKRICKRNWCLKLLSLMLAICIWCFSSLSREMHYELVLPVELRNTPPGYSVAGPLPGEVHFSLAGPAILIDGARRANSKLTLSLQDAKQGKTLFTHLETDLKLPEGIKVTRISPATLEVELTMEQKTTDKGAQIQ